MGFIVHLELVSTTNQICICYELASSLGLYFLFLLFFFLFLFILPFVIISEVKNFLRPIFKIKGEAISIQGSHQLHHETSMMCTSLHFESFLIVMPVFTNKRRDLEWKQGGFAITWILSFRDYFKINWTTFCHLLSLKLHCNTFHFNPTQLPSFKNRLLCLLSFQCNKRLIPMYPLNCRLHHP